MSSDEAEAHVSDIAEHREAENAVHALDTRHLKHISESWRFVGLTVACFAQICASASYAYNIFSASISSQYQYDFRKMSDINTVGMVFAYFLLPYGTLFDLFGPRPVYLIATVYFFIGALLFGLTFQGSLEGTVVRFAVYNAFLSLGSQLFDMPSVVTVMTNFPTRKGYVIALLKTVMGLGQALLAAIQSGLFNKNAQDFFWFLIALVITVGICVQIFVTLPDYHITGWQQKHLSEEKKNEKLKGRAAYLTQEPPMWRFWLGLIVICILIVYLPLTSALVAFKNLNLHQRLLIGIFAIIIFLLILLMMLPLKFLDKMTVGRSAAENAESDDDSETNELKGLDETDFAVEKLHQDVDGVAISDELEHEAVSVKEEKKAPRKKKHVTTDIDYIAPQYQAPFKKNLLTLTLWCIVWTFFCGLGSEFVVIYNARYIMGAINGEPTSNQVNTLLAVINGVGSSVGRLAMSYMEIKTQRRKAEDRIPITAAFFIPTSCIIISLILMLSLKGEALLAAVAFTALGNGFCASVSVLVIQTIYAKDYAKHYNFGYNSLWVAAILINRLLFGEWFASQADKQTDQQKVCYGRRCVVMPLCVMLGLNVTAFLSNIYMHVKYTRFSRRVLAERRRIREEADAAEPDAEATPENQPCNSSFSDDKPEGEQRN